MKSSRALTGALVAGAVAVATMFAASPAAAATLPPGQKITVIDQSDDQFYNVNPGNAVSTPVGTPIPIEEWESAVDVDDTGLGYAVATLWEYDGGETELAPDADAEQEPEEAPEGDVEAFVFPGGPYYPDGASIYKADANTGVLSNEKWVRIDLPGDEDPYAYDCTSLDYSKGVIVAACYLWDGYYYDGYIGTIDVTSDPEDAILTPLVIPEIQEDLLYITAIAQNPLTGVYYAFDLVYGELYSFTLDDEYVTYEGEVDGYAVFGADFDRSGQLWLSVYEWLDIDILALNPTYLDLATFDFGDNEVLPVGPFASEDPYEIEEPQALTVWGALAATGSTVSMAPAVAASGILLLGALLAAGTMVLRRRSAEVQ